MLQNTTAPAGPLPRDHPGLSMPRGHPGLFAQARTSLRCSIPIISLQLANYAHSWRVRGLPDTYAPRE